MGIRSGVNDWVGHHIIQGAILGKVEKEDVKLSTSS